MIHAPTLALDSRSSGPPPVVPRERRVALLRALMGPPAVDARPLARAIRKVAHTSFDRWVVPLVELHWPALRQDRFYEKLRIGACDLYASGPYTALFCDPRRPLVLRAVTGAASRLALSSRTLGALAEGAMEVLGRVALQDEHRRISLVAAFVMVVDHAFDHSLEHPAAVRAELLREVLQRRRLPRREPELALVGALLDALREGLDVRGARDLARALEKVDAWISAELAATRGLLDPLGLGHRLPGVEGTIDGLLFPVARYVGPETRRWMISASMYVQLMDDWLDVELDTASDRPSPMTTGDWTFADVERGWRASVEGLEDLLRDAGLDSPHYVAFVRGAYVTMMTDVMEAMVARPSE
jgi:hypothetical protein